MNWSMSTEELAEKVNAKKKVILVFSPHFDDAVLSLGGLLAKKECQSLVVTCYAGKPKKAISTPWDSGCGFPNSDQAVEARIKENELALELLGAIPINLQFLDEQYRTLDENLVIIEDEIYKGIKTTIQHYQGLQAHVYGPAGIGHPDHAIVHRSFLKVMRENLEIGKMEFFLYEDYPYVERAGSDNFENALKRQDGRDYEKRSIPLTESNLDDKIRSILHYTSQIRSVFQCDEEYAKAMIKSYFTSRCHSLTPPHVACEMLRILS